MWIKICGLSTSETVVAAVSAGADAIGFVFAPGSPRLVSPGTVRALLARVPRQIETVGVFRHQSLDDILRLARRSGVATVQLHGDEPPAVFDSVRQAGLRVIRAVSAETFAGESQDARASYGDARLLLDAPDPGAGDTFSKDALAGSPPPPGWILAGGLTPRNVAGLVERLAPAGVDVSSGVESSRGAKSAALIRAFIDAARHTSD